MRARAIVIALPLMIAACGGGDSTEPNDPVASVTISPATSQFTALAETVQLVAAVRTQGGATSSATATWQSSAQQIATVDANGLVRAVANGSAQITATVGTVSGTADVTVQQVAMRVSVTPARDSLFTGATLQLTAAATDRGNAAIPSPRTTWSSSDTSIASVSATGLVSGRKRGQARITARVDTASAGTEIIVRLTSFLATRDTVISGSLQVDRFEVAAERTVTLSGDLAIRAEGPIAVHGTIRGDCRAVDIVTLGTILVRGTLDNTCSSNTATRKRLRLVSGDSYTLDSARVVSSGGILITNDTTMVLDTTSLGMAQVASRRASSPPPANCNVNGTVGRNVKLNSPFGSPLQRIPVGTGFVCTGTLTVQGATILNDHGGDGDPGSCSFPHTSAVAGGGAPGGHISLNAGMRIILESSSLTSGDGGDGGLAKCELFIPTVEAHGGPGGDAGNIYLDAAAIVFQGGATTLAFGKGGKGGDATAIVPSPGANATFTQDAQKGYEARAYAGNGGGFNQRNLLGNVLRGAVLNAGLLVVTKAPIGGQGGTGEIRPGDGGSSTIVPHPHGADGGDGRLRPGSGGDVLLVDNRAGGGPLGTPGPSGDGKILYGNGGYGVPDCALPFHLGGNGGRGGTIEHHPAAPGKDGLGRSGQGVGTTELFDALNGRDGRHGVPPGNGGAAGKLTPIGGPVLPDVDAGGSRHQGVPGLSCPLLLSGATVSYFAGDPSHIPFLLLQLTTIFQITFAPLPSGSNNVVPRRSAGRAAPNAIVTVSGNQRWQTFSGPIDETGAIDVTFTGTFAGFPNIPARFIGRITTATDGRPTGITGTIEVGLNGTLPGGQSTTYQVRGGT